METDGLTLAYDSHKKESEAHEKLVAVDQSKTTQSWYGRWIWDSLDLPKKERKLVFKLDVSFSLGFRKFGIFYQEFGCVKRQLGFCLRN